MSRDWERTGQGGGLTANQAIHKAVTGGSREAPALKDKRLKSPDEIVFEQST